jgi:hypothetical protein
MPVQGGLLSNTSKSTIVLKHNAVSCVCYNALPSHTTLTHCICCTLLLKQRDPAASAKLHTGVSSVKAALAAAAAAVQLRQPGATATAAATAAKPSGMVSISVSSGTPYNSTQQQQQQQQQWQLHNQALQSGGASPNVTASAWNSTGAGNNICFSVCSHVHDCEFAVLHCTLLRRLLPLHISVYS